MENQETSNTTPPALVSTPKRGKGIIAWAIIGILGAVLTAMYFSNFEESKCDVVAVDSSAVVVDTTKVVAPIADSTKTDSIKLDGAKTGTVTAK